MSERVVKVTLKGEAAGLKRALQDARTESEKTANQFDKDGKKIESASGRMARSAQVNQEAWQRSGAALVGVGVAIAGVATAILKTGIAYNTLQQTSRAALLTILGSTEAVNAQMAKLDDFARQSPFAKQTFLTAQQQMLAFGIETEKVLTYLDGIQNAVAAAGGGNQQLAELAQVISKIHAAGKLTAQDFIEFGNRGVDAASIIGEQMGKTGAAIRMEVTEGLIDADDALDALVAGMNTRFAGAADNVKNTFAGSLDRVKAAWRDFSADLATPLVDPNGGGALVGWLNDLADGMRAFQKLPDSVKNSTAAVLGLTGVVSLLGGGFLLLAPRIVATKTAMDQLNISMGKTAGIAGKATAALAVMAAASGVPQWASGTATGANEAEKALLDLASGADIADTALGKFTAQNAWKKFTLGDLGSAKEMFDTLANTSAWNKFDNVLSSVATLGQTTSASRLEAEKFFASVDAGLASMAAGGKAADASRAIDILASQMGASTDEVLEFLPAYRDALAAASVEQDVLTKNGLKTAEQLEAEAEAAKAAQKALEEYHEALANANASFIDQQGAYDAVIDKNREWAQAIADSTKSAKDSYTDYYDGHTVKVKDYIKQMREQVKAQQEWHDNIDTLTARVNDDTSGELKDSARAMLDQLVQQGASGAPLIDMLAGATDAEFNKIVALWAKGGADANDAFAEGFDSALNPEVKPTLDMLGASTEYGNWVKSMSNIPIKPEVVLPSGKVGKGGGGGGPVPHAYATGGAIVGPGTGTSDSVLMWGSNGEHVWTAAEVAAAGGHGAVEMMRAAAIRGYANGGPVMTAPAPQIIQVPVTSTNTNNAPINIGTLVSSDVADFERQARMRRRNNNLGGRRG
ncbi:tape measure protein [Demequina sp.]|uniref:tape measure protein n=1 Tax=Demequina sp. TaxID=2050685 RepID=UPI003D0EC4CA